MEQTFNIVFIGDLSDLFQQLHPEPVKLKKVVRITIPTQL